MAKDYDKNFVNTIIALGVATPTIFLADIVNSKFNPIYEAEKYHFERTINKEKVGFYENGTFFNPTAFLVVNKENGLNVKYKLDPKTLKISCVTSEKDDYYTKDCRDFILDFIGYEQKAPIPYFQNSLDSYLEKILEAKTQS